MGCLSFLLVVVGGVRESESEVVFSTVKKKARSCVDGVVCLCAG